MNPNNLIIRDAKEEDLPRLVALLANDPLGSQREKLLDPIPEGYLVALRAICADANNRLIVAECDDAICGFLQMTLIPGMTFEGRSRMQVEGVRVSPDHRRLGIGRLLMNYVIDQANQQGCCYVQLTSDKRRPEAIQFYESLGFVSSHEGMKLKF